MSQMIISRSFTDTNYWRIREDSPDATATTVPRLVGHSVRFSHAPDYERAFGCDTAAIAESVTGTDEEGDFHHPEAQKLQFLFDGFHLFSGSAVIQAVDQLILHADGTIYGVNPTFAV